MNERSSFLCFSLFYLIRDLLTLHFHSFLSGGRWIVIILTFLFLFSSRRATTEKQFAT